MAGNGTKSDKLHDLLPALFNSRVNPNWKALVEALGENDQQIADLVEEVRKQLFVKTSSRPYLDILGANVRVSRPRLVGVQDTDFRKYIPILAYQPKQVKEILDKLANIFYLDDATRSFDDSQAFGPFVLTDGWTLEYTVDNIYREQITFEDTDFVNIAAATSEEVASAINRQTEHSFAVVVTQGNSNQKYVRLFTTTLGSKGSIRITGGLSNIVFRFTGFNDNSGNGANTQWTVSKVGDLVKFQHTAGTSPGINFLSEDDISFIDILNNKGSFVIERVDVSDNAFYFRNPFGTAGIYTQTTALQTKFMTPYTAAIYKNDKRAAIWETEDAKIIAELPAIPAIVKRNLKGGWHLNGVVSVMTSRVSNSSLTLSDASDFPNVGHFYMQQHKEILTSVPAESLTITKNFNSRLIRAETRFSYTGKTGNTLTGITPDLPAAAALNQFNISSASRAGTYVVTVNTSAAHNFLVNDTVIVAGTTGPVTPINGSFKIASVPSATSFTYVSVGDTAAATGGTARVERIGLANSGSIIFSIDSYADTGILGSYVWDTAAPFVLSSLTALTTSDISTGSVVKTLNIGTNSIPNESGFLIFDYGTTQQEGPIKFLYKPSANSIALDPSYVFQFDHDAGSSVTMLRTRGPHTMSGIASEYPPYLTDPIVAREELEEIMRSVKSVGIFIEFLVRYPVQYYNTLDAYRSGIDPG